MTPGLALGLRENAPRLKCPGGSLTCQDVVPKAIHHFDSKSWFLAKVCRNLVSIVFCSCPVRRVRTMFS